MNYRMKETRILLIILGALVAFDFFATWQLIEEKGYGVEVNLVLRWLMEWRDSVAPMLIMKVMTFIFFATMMAFADRAYQITRAVTILYAGLAGYHFAIYMMS